MRAKVPFYRGPLFFQGGTCTGGEGHVVFFKAGAVYVYFSE